MRRLIAVLIGGMFLDGYILGVVGPVAGTMTDALSLSDLWVGLIAGARLFGIFVGSPLGGWATDRFGRKSLFLIDMGLFTLASALQFVAGAESLVVGGAVQLFLVRLLMRVAIGGEYSIGWPLMSEFASARLRGRLLGLTLMAWYADFMVAFVIGTVLVDAGVGWRLILGSSTPLALVLRAPYFAIATFADDVLERYGLSGGFAAGVGLWAAAPSLVVLALFLLVSFFNAMYTTLTGIYPAEVLPTEIRGIGTGFAAAVSRIGAGLGTFLLP